MASLLEVINHHHHAKECWFCPAASPSGETHVADKAETKTTTWGGAAGLGFQIDAGNNAFGSWVQILGSSDTPCEGGNVMYDIHSLLVTASERSVPYLIQLGFGTVTTGVLTGTTTNIMYAPSGITGEQTDIEVHNIRIAAGVKAWARALCCGQNTGTLDFMIGLHEYDETQENDFTIDDDGYVKCDVLAYDGKSCSSTGGASIIRVSPRRFDGTVTGDCKMNDVKGAIIAIGANSTGLEISGLDGDASIDVANYTGVSITIHGLRGKLFIEGMNTTTITFYGMMGGEVEFNGGTGSTAYMIGGFGRIIGGSVTLDYTSFVDLAYASTKIDLQLVNNITTITNKLPTNYIMGSSVQSAKDDEIDGLVTELATTKGYAEDAKTASEELALKAPTNYIMGSSDQADHDTQIDLIDAALRMAIEYDFSTYSKAVILFYEDDRPLAGDPTYWAYVYTAAGGKPSAASEITKRDRLKTWASGAPS